jgi:hypothetical protein
VLLMAKAAALARAGELDAAAALAGEAAAAPAAEPPPRDAAAAGSGPDLAALDPGACRERWRAAALAKDEGNAAYRCNPGLPAALGAGQLVIRALLVSQRRPGAAPRLNSQIETRHAACIGTQLDRCQAAELQTCGAAVWQGPE